MLAVVRIAMRIHEVLKDYFFYPCEIRAIHQQILLTQEVVDEIFLMGGIVRF